MNLSLSNIEKTQFSIEISFEIYKFQLSQYGLLKLQTNILKTLKTSQHIQLGVVIIK